MSKITIVGNGFIQIGERLINLKQYKTILKGEFGYDEDPEDKSAYGIKATPLVASAEDIENGVDGSHFISIYREDEYSDFEEDFEKVSQALRDKD